VLFVGLGIWQVERRTWKLALIRTIDSRIAAAPAAPPPPATWSRFDPQVQAYRRVAVQGRFLAGRSTLVQALTERGAGYWVITPLRTSQGFVILVNRGFVPTALGAVAVRGQADAPAKVTGLLRLSEPRGRLFRANDPAADRWYSRDIAAIAAKRGLGPVAPYFIDADATPNPRGWPVGGLTVVDLPNNHLVYAVTWFALAALSLFGFVRVWRDGRGSAGSKGKVA